MNMQTFIHRIYLDYIYLPNLMYLGTKDLKDEFSF